MNRLKELRKEYGLTQSKFAAKMNVAQNTVSNWEVGVRSLDVETAIKIAIFFGVSINYLLGLSDNKKELSLAAAGTLSEKDLKHLEKYRSLDEIGKSKVDKYLAHLTELQQLKKR